LIVQVSKFAIFLARKYPECSELLRKFSPDYSAKEKRMFFLAREILITAQSRLHGRPE
jgi:hypothetical protein